MRLTTTVLIATFNRTESLLRAIESLSLQNVLPDEVIVVHWVDDVETVDALGSIVGGVANRLRPLATDSNELTFKENRAIADASGDIVCFLDDDAVADPDWLRRLLAHYADSRVGGVGGRDAGPAPGMSPTRRNRAVGRITWFGCLSGNHHEDNVGYRDVDFLKGCNMSYRREVLRPLDHTLVGSTPYGYEIDLGLSIRARGYRLVYDPGVRVSHHPSINMLADNAQLAWVVNHNQTYILLKWLSGPRRIAFLAYTFLVGDKNAIGLARIPFQCLPQRWARSSMWAHFRGKLDGIASFRRVARSVNGV